jgi:hypothetical protein
MPKKPTSSKDSSDVIEIIQNLVQHFDERFDQVNSEFTRIGERFANVDQKLAEVIGRCDRIEFLVSGQDRRISILEDRMRMVATKLGLEFRGKA